MLGHSLDKLKMLLDVQFILLYIFSILKISENKAFNKKLCHYIETRVRKSCKNGNIKIQYSEVVGEGANQKYNTPEPMMIMRNIIVDKVNL